MDLPTYTNIWRIEKRLYKLYDFRLPMPLPVGQIAVFLAIAVPYIGLLAVLGLPFSHTLLWLYVLPPGVLAWLTTRPVLESKKLPELVLSQVRYLLEPRTWCRMSPLTEKDEVVVICRVWRAAAPPASEPAVATEAAEVAEAAAPIPAACEARRATTLGPAARSARPAPRPLTLPSRTARFAPPRAAARSEAAPGEPPAARPRHSQPGDGQPGPCSHPALQLPSRGLPAQAQAGAGQPAHAPAPPAPGRAVPVRAALGQAAPGRGVPGQAARGQAGPGRPVTRIWDPAGQSRTPPIRPGLTRVQQPRHGPLGAGPVCTGPVCTGAASSGPASSRTGRPGAPDLAGGLPGRCRPCRFRLARPRPLGPRPSRPGPGRPGTVPGAGRPVQDPSAPGRATPGKPPQWLQTLRPESAPPGPAVISGEVVAPSAPREGPASASDGAAAHAPSRSRSSLERGGHGRPPCAGAACGYPAGATARRPPACPGPGPPDPASPDPGSPGPGPGPAG